MDPVQLVTPAGELREHPDVEGRIEPELCRVMFRAMVLGRRLDTEAFALQRQGELGLWLQCHGQEAAQVGSISALRSTDYVFPSYREHAAALVRGITPAQLLVQWRGNAHSGWDSEAYRFHIYTLVLAAQLLHATGYARGIQLDGAEEVVLAYLGDGASSEGDTSEAFNFAAIADAPIVFFCQNNQWAISTPTSAQSRTPLHERARGFGLRTMVVDGNDVLAVHAVTTQLAGHARNGSGPAFIEALTYRIGGHSTSDDPTRYRSASELDAWVAKDPLDRIQTLLSAQDWADGTFFDELTVEADDLAADTRRACTTLPVPDLLTHYDHVLVEPPAALRRERDRFAAYTSSFAD